MKKWILGALLLIGQISFSQISINSTHMPRPGDTLRFSTALLDTAILFNYQNSGANLTWNFDSLRVISQTVQEFVSASQTPYNAGANRIGLLFADTLRFGATEIYDAYNFLNNTPTDFSIDYRGATAPNPIIPSFPLRLEDSYIDKDEVFQFPLDYQDRDSSTFNFTFNSPLGIYYESRGYRINDVDAWGTVTTPFGTFNTIRVVTDMVSFDTISALGQNFGIPSHIREYQWISDQERIPVMKVNGTVIAGAFIPTTVEFRDSARVVEPLFPTRAFFNADTTAVTVNELLDFNNFSTGSTSFQWDFTPNTVAFVNGSATSRNISVEFQNAGLYSVRLIASGGTRSDTLDRVDYIAVTAGNLPKADFEVEADSAVTNTNFAIYNKSQNGNTYLWNIVPRTFKFEPGSDFTSPDSIVVQFSDTGYYEVSLIATNTSGADTLAKERAVFVKLPVGLREINNDQNFFDIFPNPVKKGEAFKIGPFYSQQVDYQIVDVKGAVIASKNVEIANNYLLVDQKLASGIYYIIINHRLGTELEKLIVE